MSRTLSSLALALLSLAHAEDVLRFTNGDQLHGSFQGINEATAILWNRPDLTAPLTLQSSQVRHVLLQTQQAPLKADSFAYLSLACGDQIPGEVLSMTKEQTVIRSHAVGEITLPTSQILAIHPQPVGGTIHYLGPYAPDGWEVLAEPENPPRPQPQVEVKPVAPAADDAKAEKKKSKSPAWVHAGTAWYHTKGTEPLARKDCLGERTMLRFRLSWRERLNANIALHADFSPPPAAAAQQEPPADGAAAPKRMAFFNGMPQNQVQLYGNALVLNIYQTYFSLNRCGYDATGQIISQRMMHTQSNVQLPDSGDATIEIRSDRSKGMIILFVNGQYAAQWEDIEQLKSTPADAADPADPKLGHGFAIQCTNANAPMRIADFLIADWNGIKDSAHSMSHDQRDIILLSNGTDRYSGEILRIDQQKAFFRTQFSTLEIPLSEIAEINFARPTTTPPENSEGTVTARFYPVGKISGIPLSSAARSLQLRSRFDRPWQVDLTHAIAIEFNDENPFLETMDEAEQKPLTPENPEAARE
jgi:hypothetical protein